MGLFDIFKKTPKAPPKTKPINLEDINPLDINSIIAWYKSQKPDATEQDILDFVTKLAAPAKDQDHLTPEGDLPWGWFGVHNDIINPIEFEYKKYWQLWFDTRSSSPKKHIAATEMFVESMAQIKSRCEKMGECFNYWRTSLFTDDYLLERINELETLRQNITELEANFQAKADFETNVLPTLEKQLLCIIKENPGIMQKDIYKMFAPEGKNHVQEKLYYAEKSKKIRREKSGNSYKLYIK